MSAVRKVVARATTRIISRAAAFVVPAAAVEGASMSIANWSGRVNADLRMEFRVGKWTAWCPQARFHIQARDPSSNALRYEWGTGAGQNFAHAQTWLETISADTLLICKMPAIDTTTIGPGRLAYDLRVENPADGIFSVLCSGIINLVAGVTL